LEIKDKNTYINLVIKQNNKIMSRSFNKIIINKRKKTFKKIAINSSYKHLLLKEIEWFKHNKSNSLKLLHYTNNSYTIPYLENYITMDDYIRQTKDFSVLDKEIDLVKKMHEDKIPVAKNILERDLKIEVYKKVISRVNSVKNIIIDYDEQYFLSLLQKAFIFLNSNIKTKFYSFIHGDLNGSNAMVNSVNKDIKFVDPRGYFGETQLYGLAEYDFAKINYFLYGYDHFNKHSYLYSLTKYDKPKILFKHKFLDNKIYRVLVAIIYIALSSYISNNIFKINIAYHHGLELLKKELQ